MVEGGLVYGAVMGYRAAVSSNYIVGRNLSLLAKAAIFCAYNRTGEIAPKPDVSVRERLS